VQWNVVVSSWRRTQLRFRAVGGKSRGKKSAYEDRTCDVKSLCVLQYSDIRVSVCSWKSELELVQCSLDQLVNGEEQDDLFTVKVL
jgi:hypothetical protein